MDSVPLEMDDIFGEYEGDDDDDNGLFNPSRLPDLEDELEPMRDNRQNDPDRAEDGEDGEVNAELLAKLKNMKGASKNTTKRSMPKLDAARLTGERGVAILPKAFEKIPLKGRGHEAQDLKVMMHTLQHWGHRLFPKMTFDEVLERVERLGAKKEVQTCLKKIRLDLPVLESDFVGEDDDDDVQRAGDSGAQELRENGSSPNNHDRTVNDSHNDLNEISDDELEDLLREQAQPVQSQVQPTQDKKLSTPGNSVLSEDVRKKIEENKRKAMERRAAKLAAVAGNADGSHDPTNSSKMESMGSNIPDSGVNGDSELASASTEVADFRDVTAEKNKEGENEVEDGDTFETNCNPEELMSDSKQTESAEQNIQQESDGLNENCDVSEGADS